VHDLIATQDAAVRTALSWPVPPPPPAPPKRRRWVPVVTALAAVCALAAGSLLALAVAKADADPPSAGANLDPTSLDTLRRADPCRVLDDVTVPGAGKLRADPSAGYLDRCSYESRSGGKISVKLGDQIYVEGGRPTEDLNGRQVLFTEISGGTCDASVQVPAQPELGVTALAETCALAKATLGKVLDRLHGGGNGYTLAPGTLLALDPCAVLDRTAVARAIGPVRETKLNRVRECEWTATTSLRLTFEKTPTGVPDEGSPVDLGGVTGTRRELEGSCALAWNHRPLDAQESEHVRIFASKTGGGACDAAVEFGKALVKALPR
jgi:hypothetical protein